MSFRGQYGLHRDPFLLALRSRITGKESPQNRCSLHREMEPVEMAEQETRMALLNGWNLGFEGMATEMYSDLSVESFLMVIRQLVNLRHGMAS